jgi:hypothetical protein
MRRRSREGESGMKRFAPEEYCNSVTDTHYSILEKFPGFNGNENEER